MAGPLINPSCPLTRRGLPSSSTSLVTALFNDTPMANTQYLPPPNHRLGASFVLIVYWARSVSRAMGPKMSAGEHFFLTQQHILFVTPWACKHCTPPARVGMVVCVRHWGLIATHCWGLFSKCWEKLLAFVAGSPPRANMVGGDQLPWKGSRGLISSTLALAPPPNHRVGRPHLGDLVRLGLGLLGACQ